MGDTLLDQFRSNEIKTVLAHELGHHVKKDIHLSIIVETVSTVASLFLVSIGLRWDTETFVLQGPADIASLPVFMRVMGLYGLIAMPLTNALSRWREVLAEVDPEPWVDFCYTRTRRWKSASAWRSSSNELTNNIRKTSTPPFAFIFTFA